MEGYLSHLSLDAILKLKSIEHEQEYEVFVPEARTK